MRLHKALPTFIEAAGGGAAWGALMAASAGFGVYADGWKTETSIAGVAGNFFAGGLAAYPASLFAYRLFATARAFEARMALALLTFSTATVGLTALIYALSYRDYYAEWHAGIFSVEWVFQFVFTIAGAIYQFAIFGMRLYFPVGFLALFAIAIVLARKPR